MSYDLRVWEPPAGQASPASFEEAVRGVLALEQQPASAAPNPKFAELAAQMAAQLASSADHRGRVWACEAYNYRPAVAHNCRRAVWSFALPADHRVPVLCAVVKMANALGLAVLDEQLGLALVPPDGVLPPERAGLWKSAMQHAQEDARHANTVPTSKTLAAARDALKPALTALLAPLGFISPRLPLDAPYYHAKAEATWFRTTPAGGQGITLLTSTTNSLPCITIDVNVFSNQIADILRVVFPEHDEMYFRRQLNFHVGIFQGVFVYVPVQSPADLQRLVAEMTAPVVPLLEMARTPLGMQAILGGSADFPLPADRPQDPNNLAQHLQRNYGYAALVSAWLHGGDQFAAMAQDKRAVEERQAPGAMKEAMVERVDRLVAYLRGHVARK